MADSFDRNLENGQSAIETPVLTLTKWGNWYSTRDGDYAGCCAHELCMMLGIKTKPLRISLRLSDKPERNSVAIVFKNAGFVWYKRRSRCKLWRAYWEPFSPSADHWLKKNVPAIARIMRGGWWRRHRVTLHVTYRVHE